MQLQEEIIKIVFIRKHLEKSVYYKSVLLCSTRTLLCIEQSEGHKLAILSMHTLGGPINARLKNNTFLGPIKNNKYKVLHTPAPILGGSA